MTWELYDALIAGVPEEVQVRDYCLGLNWSYVAAECGWGVAYTLTGGAKFTGGRDLRGASLREVAMLSKSWCFQEATLGVAALNAWYGRPDLLEKAGVVWEERRELPDGAVHKMDAFELLRPRIQATPEAQVVVIGHFPHVGRLAQWGRLTVLERRCSDDLDTPDPACEFTVPQADFVFQTGVTFQNKTAPRLLQLGRDAHVTLVGPSVVMAPALFDFGADLLAGSVVGDPSRVEHAVKSGGGMRFGDALLMAQLWAEDPVANGQR